MSDGVGLRYREDLSGFVHEAPTTDTMLGLTLTVKIPSLRVFLGDSLHEAQIEAGIARWGIPPRVAAVRPGGRIEFFPDPGAGGEARIAYNLSFHDSSLGLVTVAGEKSFVRAKAADPVIAANLLAVTLQAAGAAMPGSLHGSTSATIKSFQSPDVLGAPSPADAQAGREEFLAFVHGEITKAYPFFPRPFQARSALNRDAWYLLSVLASVLLVESPPPDGPNLSEVLDNLEAFLRESAGGQISRVSQLLDFVAAVVPLDGVDRKELRRKIRGELEGPASLLRQILQALHLLVVFPYYAHPRGGRLIGYKPPPIRPRANLTLAVSDAPPDRVFDVAIVGSGVAGSLLAQRLSNAGKSVILLEQGRYTPERALGSDEVVATSRLYKDSGLQQANGALLAQIFEPKEHPAFVVLQGSCVGGGAMVNNAICFRLPSRRLADWRAAGFPFSEADLEAGYAAAAADLSIGPSSSKVEDPAAMLNPAPGYFSFDPAPVSDCLLNFYDFTGGDTGCTGNGLCNMGCGAERKKNALQVYLPEAIAAGMVLVPQAAVEEIVPASAPGSPAGEAAVDRLRVLLQRSGAHVEVRARHFVLSAGAVASSHLLLRSPGVRAITGQAGLPVGKNLAANIDSGVFAVVPGPPRTRTYVQMAHFVETSADSGFVVESWFAPPGMLAIAMPGYFEDHLSRMRNYGRTVGAAVLVGTETPGDITAEGDKAVINLPLRAPETKRLRDGLAALCRAFLRGGPAGKPEVVILGFDGGREIRTEADVAAFERDLTSLERLVISTAHPQGGNALSAGGVVDASFRVRGFSNLRVCDASVFPLSAGVNPQWTVMALAHLCGERLLAGI